MRQARARTRKRHGGLTPAAKNSFHSENDPMAAIGDRLPGASMSAQHSWAVSFGGGAASRYSLIAIAQILLTLSQHGQYVDQCDVAHLV